MASVTPFFKNGPGEKPSKSHVQLSRRKEAIRMMRVSWHMDNDDIVGRGQCGYCRAKPFLTDLLQVTGTLSDYIDKCVLVSILTLSESF